MRDSSRLAVGATTAVAGFALVTGGIVAYGAVGDEGDTPAAKHLTYSLGAQVNYNCAENTATITFSGTFDDFTTPVGQIWADEGLMPETPYSGEVFDDIVTAKETYATHSGEKIFFSLAGYKTIEQQCKAAPTVPDEPQPGEETPSEEQPVSDLMYQSGADIQYNCDYEKSTITFRDTFDDTTTRVGSIDLFGTRQVNVAYTGEDFLDMVKENAGYALDPDFNKVYFKLNALTEDEVKALPMCTEEEPGAEEPGTSDEDEDFVPNLAPYTAHFLADCDDPTNDKLILFPTLDDEKTPVLRIFTDYGPYTPGTLQGEDLTRVLESADSRGVLEAEVKYTGERFFFKLPETDRAVLCPAPAEEDPVVTPTPTPTPTPTDKPAADEKKELAETGAEVATLASLVTLFAAAGIASVVVSRKRA